MATTIVTPAQSLAVVRSNESPIPGQFARLYGPSGGSVQLLTREAINLSYEQIYRRQPWVFSIVNKLSRGTARIPLKTFEYTDEDEASRIRVKNHPLARLIKKPYPRHAAYNLKFFIKASLGVYGNALMIKMRHGPGQSPYALWPVPWRWVQVVADEGSTVPYLYIVQGPTSQAVFLPEDVVHVAYWGGSQPIGVSPLEPLRQTLALEDAAQVYAASIFQHAATPRGVFKVKGQLKPAAGARMRAELERLYAGPENGGRFALVDDTLDFTPVTGKVVDTALIESRKLSREEVCAAFDLAPPMIGILERATNNNIEELHRGMYVDTLGPDLTLIEEVLEIQLIEPEPEFQGTFLEFDMAEILRGDLPSRSKAYQMQFQAAVRTPNENRQSENLAPIGDPNDPSNPANMIYVPANMIPVGASPEEIAARASHPPPVLDPNGGAS